MWLQGVETIGAYVNGMDKLVATSAAAAAATAGAAGQVTTTCALWRSVRRPAFGRPIALGRGSGQTIRGRACECHTSYRFKNGSCRACSCARSSREAKSGVVRTSTQSDECSSIVPAIKL